jgi:hypothetical protein
MNESPEKKIQLKKSIVYVLLFSMPALLAAIIISLFLFGAAAGFFWLFVFGDNPWPHFADMILTAVYILVFFSVWSGLLYAAYAFGNKQPDELPLNTRHVMMSIRATALLSLFVLVYQWKVGNIGSKPESVMCMEFCQAKGFTSSGMTPQNEGDVMCSCFDQQGKEIVKVPMSKVLE